MAQWREWWFAMLVGCCLLGLASCSDRGIDDNASEVQTVTEPTRVELGMRLAPKGFNLNGLSPAEVEQVARGSYLVNGVNSGCACHTTTAGYLAGGDEELPTGAAVDEQGLTTVVSRNPVGMRLGWGTLSCGRSIGSSRVT